jgi:hypothetical protein
MADTILPRVWVKLFNGVAKHVYLGKTFDDEAKYLNRFKVHEKGLKYKIELVEASEKYSEHQKNKIIHKIIVELTELNNLDMEGPSGLSIKDRIWRDAHANPNGKEGLTLKYGYKKANEILLAKELSKLGPLRTPQGKMPLPTISLSGIPEVPPRWDNASKYYRMMKKRKRRSRSEQ